MTSKADISHQASELRRQAEKIALEKPVLSLKDLQAMSAEEIQQILHELRVHQIELEVQNEEQRTAQVEIDAGRARYFDLYDLAPVSYCTLSEHGLILEANFTTATLLGMARGMLIKQQLSRFILKEDQDIYFLHRKQLFETGEPQQCELRLVKPDGALFWAQLAGTAAQGVDGGAACRMVITDISERKHAENDLRESEEKFFTAFQTSPYAITITGAKDGEFIEINDAFMTMTGFTREEAHADSSIGLKLWMNIEDRDRVVNDLRAGLTVVGYEYQFRIKGDKTFMGSFSARTIRLGDKQCILSSIEDITDRKRAEEALKEANVVLAQKDALLRSMLLNLPFDFWARDLQQNMLIQSRESVRMWGDLTGTAFHEADFTPEYLEVWKSTNARVLTGEVVTSEQAYVVCGEQRQFHAIVAPILQAKEIQGILGINIDITELKRTEKALREKECKLNDILDNAITQIWAFDGQHYTYFNKAYYDFTGLEPRERLSIESWTKFIHPDDLELAGTVWSKAWETEKEHDNFFRLRNKTGEYRDFWCHAVPIFHNDRLSHFQGYNLDITERKRAEDLLRESEERFKALHNASFGGIAIHDQGVILECNQGLAEISGFSTEELIGMDVLLLISEKTRGKVLKNIRDGYEKPYEAIGLRKNNDEYPLRVEGRNIPYRGKNVRVVEFRDITEAKQADADREKLQAQLQQAQKMEAIGTLAGGIAHDFNNILGAILGYAEMAQEDSPAGSILRQDIDQIVMGSHRARELVKQILAFSRQAETERIPLQPASIIKEAIKMLRSSLPSTIDIKQNIDMDAGLIQASPTQIHQIVMNLGTNAFHAMEETGGTLVISLEKKTLNERDIVDKPGVQPGDFVQLSVGDTGPGIAPELWDKIFDNHLKGTSTSMSVE